MGHNRINFQARLICINCSGPDHKAIACPKRATPASLSAAESICTERINLPNMALPKKATASVKHCSIAVRCATCGAYSHVDASCWKRRFSLKWKWVPKVTHTHSASVLASSSTSKIQKPPLCSVPSAVLALALSQSPSPMANYPFNPVPFLPPGFAVEPGPADRVVHSGMVVVPIAPLNHEFLAINQPLCASSPPHNHP